MIRGLTLLLLPWLLLVWALPADAQQVDFSALVRYGDACLKLKAAILTDAGKELGIHEHVIEWISECNGSVASCPDARESEEGVSARVPRLHSVARSGIGGVCAVFGENWGAAPVYRAALLIRKITGKARSNSALRRP
jgi:hypothetical protein